MKKLAFLPVLLASAGGMLTGTSPRTATALPTATAYGGTGGGLALRRRTQKTAVAATSDQITNADSLANMRRLSWNALRLRASER